MLGTMGLKAKLVAICGLLAFFTLTVGAVGFYALEHVSADYKHVSNNNLPNVTALGEMNANFRRARTNLTVLLVDEANDKQRTESPVKVAESLEAYEKSSKQYESVVFVPGEAELYKPVAANYAEFKKDAADILNLSKSNDPADRAKLVKVFNESLPKHADDLSHTLGSLIKFQNAEAEKWVDKADTTHQTGNVVSIAVAISGSFISGLVGFVFASRVSKSLSATSEHLASGAAVVATASRQVSSASTSLSSCTTEQAAALQETVAAIDEINAMIGRNADAATRSQQVSTTSHDAAQKGKRAVDEMIASIRDIDVSTSDIARQTETSNKEISEIVKVIGEIGNKTKVINDIVFQTKLLSFNASVEAARAGEHGKGFAVVAEEVGNLAAMSGTAAREISDLLDSSIKKVETIVGESKRGIEALLRSSRDKVERGTQTAANCGESLDSLVRYAGELNKMVTEIASGCKEQATGIEEINKAMSSLDQVTHQNASAAEESAAAAAQLDQQAYGVEAMVQELSKMVLGANAASQKATTQKTPSKAPAAAPIRATVIPIKRNASPSPAATSTAYKKAAGGESMPSADDPRFEDV